MPWSMRRHAGMAMQLSQCRCSNSNTSTRRRNDVLAGCTLVHPWYGSLLLYRLKTERESLCSVLDRTVSNCFSPALTYQRAKCALCCRLVRSYDVRVCVCVACLCVRTRVHVRAAECRHACTRMWIRHVLCRLSCACVVCCSETSQSDACMHTAASFCILFHPVTHTHDPSVFPMGCHKRTCKVCGCGAC